jgi:hypothetical protein
VATEATVLVLSCRSLKSSRVQRQTRITIVPMKTDTDSLVPVSVLYAPMVVSVAMAPREQAHALLDLTSKSKAVQVPTTVLKVTTAHHVKVCVASVLQGRIVLLVLLVQVDAYLCLTLEKSTRQNSTVPKIDLVMVVSKYALSALIQMLAVTLALRGQAHVNVWRLLFLVVMVYVTAHQGNQVHCVYSLVLLAMHTLPATLA